MEHAAEALKLAFAVILLVLALSLTMSIFAKVNSTADIVLSANDRTIYDTYNQYILPEDKSGNRIVGMETVIPTLYKYSKERYKVVFKKGSYDEVTKSVNISGPLVIYKSSANNEDISSFDIVEENKRGEPWLASPEQIKLNLDAILSGSTYSNGIEEIDYNGNPLANMQKKFVEQVGEIVVKKENTEEMDSNEVIGKKTTKKRIITYILIN